MKGSQIIFYYQQTSARNFCVIRKLHKSKTILQFGVNLPKNKLRLKNCPA